jgi:hypothetical protein
MSSPRPIFVFPSTNPGVPSKVTVATFDVELPGGAGTSDVPVMSSASSGGKSECREKSATGEGGREGSRTV